MTYLSSPKYVYYILNRLSTEDSIKILGLSSSFHCTAFHSTESEVDKAAFTALSKDADATQDVNSDGDSKIFHTDNFGAVQGSRDENVHLRRVW
jgi:hypothetical protein